MGSAIRSVETAGCIGNGIALERCLRQRARRLRAADRQISRRCSRDLARLAGEVAAAPCSVSPPPPTRLAQPASRETTRCFLEAASAKIRTAEAAAEGSAIAHQVFGAIGFTKEHMLHRFTLRSCPGVTTSATRSYWAAELGRQSPAAALMISGHWSPRDDGASAIRPDPAAARMRRAARTEVRAFLAEESAAGTFDPHPGEGWRRPQPRLQPARSARRAGSA
jgi:alkylation response protein AidB-like acyl-CoA dehydrogenase